MTWQEWALTMLPVVIGFAWFISLQVAYHKGWCTGFAEHRKIVDKYRR